MDKAQSVNVYNIKYILVLKRAIDSFNVKIIDVFIFSIIVVFIELSDTSLLKLE